MNCAEVKEQFETAFDGALAPELEKGLMLHVRGCSSCQTAWDAMQSLRSMLRASTISAPSHALDHRVMEAFNRAHREEARAWWHRFVFGTIALPKPAFALALIAFASLLALALYVGRLTATPIQVTTRLANTAEAAAPLSQRIIYVPVEAARSPQTISSTASSRPRTPRRTIPTGTVAQKPSATRPLENLLMVSSSGTDYATKATLRDFQPLEAASVRVIKGRGE